MNLNRSIRRFCRHGSYFALLSVVIDVGLIQFGIKPYPTLFLLQIAAVGVLFLLSLESLQCSMCRHEWISNESWHERCSKCGTPSLSDKDTVLMKTKHD